VTIGLRATDSNGLTGTTTVELTVSNPPEDDGCNSTTTSPASALAVLAVGAFLMTRRARRRT
jgi:uncharacterized protein (TIGR03382 family)